MEITVLHLLSPTTKRRVEFILKHPGLTLRQYSEHFGVSSDIDRELDTPLSKRKGSVGVFVEWLLVGSRGDNLCAADDGVVEIKTVSVSSKSKKYSLGNGLSPKENLRLTTVNFNAIQTTPYVNSGVAKKSIMLVALISSAQSDLRDRTIEGIGFIDLKNCASQVETDYEHIATACRNGKAHTLTSSASQVGKILKVYSHGSRKNLASYTDAEGYAHEAKSKSFYLFKQQICDLLHLTW